MELCAFQSEEKFFSPYKCGPPYYMVISYDIRLAVRM